MAKELKLRDYQNSILAKLESIKNADAAPPAGYLGVVIGSRNVLVDLQEITETLPLVDIQVVPLVKPWFLGVSNVRGVLYAINDLAQMLDNSLTQISSNTRLLLISEGIAANIAFVADRLIGLRNITDLTKLEKNPDNKSESELQTDICLKPDVYEDAEKRLWVMLDCDKLIHSKEFITPYVTH